MAESFPRVLIFDPLSQYETNGYDLVCRHPQELKEFLREHQHGQPFRILYQPKDLEPVAHWRKVGVLAYATGDLLICIDELGLLCEYGQLKVDAKGKEPILKSIVHYGRHRKIHCIATAQRPTDVAMRYRALCSEVRCFQTNEPKDLTYIQERVGQLAANRLPTLPKYAFLHWTDDGIAVYKPKLRR